MKRQTTQNDYTIRKLADGSDNWGLFFRGALVEYGVFATRRTAEKYKSWAENERRQRLEGRS